jgi:hypothetical protein
MRKQIRWFTRLEDGTKRDARVSIGAGKLKWQFKLADEPAWDYDTPPSAEDWETLLDRAEAKYRRNSMPLKDVDLIRKGMQRAKQ